MLKLFFVDFFTQLGSSGYMRLSTYLGTRLFESGCILCSSFLYQPAGWLGATLMIPSSVSFHPHMFILIGLASFVMYHLLDVA